MKFSAHFLFVLSIFFHLVRHYLLYEFLFPLLLPSNYNDRVCLIKTMQKINWSIRLWRNIVFSRKRTFLLPISGPSIKNYSATFSIETSARFIICSLIFLCEWLLMISFWLSITSQLIRFIFQLLHEYPVHIKKNLESCWELVFKFNSQCCFPSKSCLVLAFIIMLLIFKLYFVY